jgi:hypothetical protein
MKQRGVLGVSIAIALGGFFGFCAAKYLEVVSDFPRTMLLRSVIPESTRTAPPATALRVLDLYEIEVSRQNVWYGFSKFAWDQELININLCRYVIYSNAKQSEPAQKALVQAATLRKYRSPTKEEIEFERQLAERLFLTEERPPSG